MNIDQSVDPQSAFFRWPLLRCLWLFLLFAPSLAAAPIEGFKPLPTFDEQIFQKTMEQVRIVIDAPGNFDSHKPTELIIYALPNGNSIEQTIGCTELQGRDWHFYIQHIGAQVRALRAVESAQNIVVAYVEASTDGIGKSWPTWRQRRVGKDAAAIRTIVDAIAAKLPGKVSITLAAHSGGGSFITGYLNSADVIDPRITRIAYLDANYSYDDDQHHGDKLLAWLRSDKANALVVIAYDDRNITLNGKPVVGPTGGTWRASHRMIDRFGRELQLPQQPYGDSFDSYSGLNGQIRFFLHRNPTNEILHTRLVGEMSGFLAACTMNTPHQSDWGTFAGPAVYAKWIAADILQLEPAVAATSKPASPLPASTKPADLPLQLELPARPTDAVTGTAFIDRLSTLPRDQREAEIIAEVSRGNVPRFCRTLKPVTVKFTGNDGIPHLASYNVCPDYLAIGSDADFVRIPMLPATAQKLADLLHCTLPTRKMVDDMDAQATIRLEPQPMTEAREAPATFLAHNRLIEKQLAEKGKNAFSGELICGIKKDLVVTNRLAEKPHRVAIYGWRKADGKPIQPLTIVHADTYVDYSHGLRLIGNAVLIDGKAAALQAALRDPLLCGLFSDEGTIAKPDYRP